MVKILKFPYKIMTCLVRSLVLGHNVDFVLLKSTY